MTITELATNARCVGSNPSETPITEESDTGTYTNTYSYFSSPINYNNQFKLREVTLKNINDILLYIKDNINEIKDEDSIDISLLVSYLNKK